MSQINVNIAGRPYRMACADGEEEHRANHGDRGVLALQVGVRAFLDGTGNLLHALIAGGQRNDPAGRENAVGNGNGRAHEGEDESVLLEHGGVRGYVSESGDARTAEHPAYSLMRRD